MDLTYHFRPPAFLFGNAKQLNVRFQQKVEAGALDRIIQNLILGHQSLADESVIQWHNPIPLIPAYPLLLPRLQSGKLVPIDFLFCLAMLGKLIQSLDSLGCKMLQQRRAVFESPTHGHVPHIWSAAPPLAVPIFIASWAAILLRKHPAVLANVTELLGTLTFRDEKKTVGLVTVRVATFHNVADHLLVTRIICSANKLVRIFYNNTGAKSKIMMISHGYIINILISIKFYFYNFMIGKFLFFLSPSFPIFLLFIRYFLLRFIRSFLSSQCLTHLLLLFLRQWRKRQSFIPGFLSFPFPS